MSLCCCFRSGSLAPRCGLATALVLLAGTLSGRGDEPAEQGKKGPDSQAAAKKVDPRVIAKLIEDLGSDDFDDRKAASQKLTALGEPALASLRKALKHSDPDVRLRAVVIIGAIEKAIYGEALILTGHTAQVVGVDLSRDGRLAVSGGDDRTARVWDLKDGKELRRLAGLSGNVWGVSLSPDGKQVLAAQSTGHLSLHEVETGKLVRSFARLDKAVRGVCFLPDGKRAVSINYDKLVRLLDVETGKELKQFVGHTTGQLSLALSLDGKSAVSGNGQHEKASRLWDISQGKLLHVLDGHTDRVLGCAFSPDGRQVVTTCWDRQIRLWEVQTGKLMQTLKASDRLYGAAFSPDGKTLAVGEEKGGITLWMLATGKAVRQFAGHTAAVNMVRFDSEGKKLVSASKDRTVRVWPVRR